MFDKLFNLKKIMIFLLMILIVSSLSFYLLRKNSVQTTTTDVLISVNQKQFKEKISKKESFSIYIGRPSCPDCKKFVPKIEKELTSINKKILYYNTQAPASEKKQIRNFLKKFGVIYVPTIIDFKEGKVENIYNCTKEDQFYKFIKKEKKE